MIRQIARFGNKILLSAQRATTFRSVYRFQDNKDRSRVETNVHTWANNLPQSNSFHTDTLETQEIQSRILKVLSNFEQINLKTLQWNTSFKKLGLDSLNQTAVLASIEHEFTLIFPDGIFEGFDNLQQVVSYIETNINSI